MYFINFSISSNHDEDSCTCTVTFENGRERQDAWGKVYQKRFQTNEEFREESIQRSLERDELKKLGKKPKVFTHEEAETIQKEKLDKIRKNSIIELDKIQKSDIIESERFNRSKESLPNDYISALETKYSFGTEIAKKVYSKFITDGNIVADTDYTGTPGHKNGKIYLKFSDDLENPRGAGTTWFHEHGHYIDYKNNNVSLSENFKSSLTADFIEYEEKRMANLGVLDIESIREMIGLEMRFEGDVSHSVQDIYGGMIKKRYPCTKWGHEDFYWNKDSDYVYQEAFAHMFEASFNPDKIELMKKYLPKSWAEFEKILGGLV